MENGRYRNKTLIMNEKSTTPNENSVTLNEHHKEEYAPAHTTEHILNQAMIRHFGCGRSIEAHIERKKSKQDFRRDREPSEEAIRGIEDEVNRVIGQHLPVTYSFITQDEARSRFDLQRLPDNASETVRVVQIGDYDACLCIGNHVGNTDEIGRFRILSHSYDSEKGVLRLRWKLEDSV